MESPFPGMDPFIEGQEWQPFHVTGIVEIQRQLVSQLPENYIIQPELSITAQDLILGERKNYRPDVFVLNDASSFRSAQTPSDSGTLTEPTVWQSIPKTKQRTIVIREVKSRQIVTAVEFLSPSNKRGGDLVRYQRKRDFYEVNGINLLEIDLLRGGIRPYYAEEWPPATYCIQLIEPHNDSIKLWAVDLEQKLPIVPVPLLPQDQPLRLNLQNVFEQTYAINLYSRLIDYRPETIKPGLSEKEHGFVKTVINQ